MKALRLTRRTVLRGAGAGLALPALEAMMDGRGRLRLSAAEAAEGGTAGAAPVRFLGFLMQNGCPKQWYSPVPVGAPAAPAAGAPNVLSEAGGGVRYYDPAKVGEQYDLNVANKPLEPFKKDLNMITGLHQECLASVFHHSDGAVGCFTGHPMHSKPRDGKPEIGAAPSLEWVLGKSVGKDLPHQALYMGLRRDAPDTTNRWYRSSWMADSVAAPVVDKPRALAEKFIPKMPGTAMPDPAAVAEARRGKSIIDFMRSDAKRLQGRLGMTDRARLEQHLSAVRDLERDLEASERGVMGCSGSAPAAPEGYLADEEQMPLMAKIIAFGFSCDLFRYGLFHVQMLYPLPGRKVQDDHDQSHFITSKDNIYYWEKKMAFLAHLLDALKKTPDGSQNLLYNTIVCTGVDVAVGAKHNFDDLPIIVAGNAGGRMKTGRHLHYPKTTYNNLYASILNFCGLPTQKFGADGTGTLSGLG